MVNLQSISLEAFQAIDGARRIIVHDHPRQFARLDLGESLGCYGLSWRSNLPLIQPVIAYAHDRQTLWVGVDQRLAAIDLQDGHISLSLALYYNLFQILPTRDWVAVLTELEVLLFANSDCSLFCSQALPDLAAELLIVNSDLVIRLDDDRRLSLNP
ncbi:MAG: hypothetical protein KME45_07300 [Stenomitos rutilans HA7619-LM2]|jgi:hypothetical protein|nr:hypothetical protein [Stenomitos rutilans HA7619-LM2]